MFTKFILSMTDIVEKGIEHMYVFLSFFFCWLSASLWKRLLNRASASHLSLNVGRNLLVIRVHALHCLVLGLLGLSLDLLLLLRVLRVALWNRCNGLILLIFNCLNSSDSLICWHVVIDRLTMSK